MIGRGDDETKRAFGPVADAERVAEVFDPPVEPTTLPSLDRRFVWVAVASVALAAVGVVIVVVALLGPPMSWLLALLLFPAFAIVPKGFWKLAHS